MRKFLKVFFWSIGSLVLLFVGYFIIIRLLDNKAVNTKDFYESAYKVKTPALLPSFFLAGQRFYIQLVTRKGDTLMALGDTGGGISMIMPKTMEQIGLERNIKLGIVKALMPVRFLFFDQLIADPNIPPPEPLRNMIIRRPFQRVKRPVLIVPKMDGELKFMMKQMAFDIFLGQNFFMGHAWTFDYLKKEVWVNTPIRNQAAADPHILKLGFKKNSNGKAIYGHPSFTIEVDGAQIDVLFDTGASIVLSDDGKKLFHTTQNTIGGSFIASSVFDRWRTRHPEWKYYNNATRSHEIIEVPKIKIGGYEVGPVIFAKRPDEAWSQGMIHSMDKVVQGAIGGSALQYLKVTIDYNSELIKFDR